MDGNKHYIRLDSNNNIVKGFSDAFEQAIEWDICINENGGRHFELFDVVNPAIQNKGIYLYKYADGVIIPKSQEEIEQEMSLLPLPPKTAIEILQETVDALVLSSLEV